jgi:putative endopeptidase
MSSRAVLRSVVLGLVAAILLGQAGCRRSTDAEVAAAPQAAPVWSLDESKLVAPIGFSATDLDPTRSACNDLSAYANDKWLAANPIPGDKTSWGPWDVLELRSLGIQRQLAERAAAQAAPAGIEKIIADFWVSGMDEARINAEGLTPLKDRLAAIDTLKDGDAVADHLRKVAATGENPLFAFIPEADFKDSSMTLGYAIQGGLGLPDKTYYFDADKQSIRQAYESHIARVLELSGAAADLATAQARSVLAFETRLARVSKSSEDLSRDISLYYNPMTPAAADALTANFSWTAFFRSQGIAVPAKFSLAMPEFHREVSTMLRDVPVDEWKAYLRYHLVDDASPYLSDPFVTEHFEFHDKTLAGQKEQKQRWKRVLGTINQSAGEAMGQLYVEVAFPPSSKARMEELVANLGQALKVRIENLPWMSDATKLKALEKWATFTPKIGYPDKWRDWTGLATQSTSYVGNVFSARAFDYRWELGKIGKPVDKTEWDMPPQAVNAYYNPFQNEIVFPAGILQPPFFDPQADDALNYGAIGAVIGHEMTHGYDDQGSRFGPTGNFEVWWTDDDAAKFKELTSQLTKQYDGYEAAPGLKVNGNLTLGENIADLGGLSVAYDAMQRAVAGKPDPKVDGLSRDQRFFLGWATAFRTQYTPELLKVIVASDPHAPDLVRASAAPTNVPAFAPAFDCKGGDAMRRGGEQLVVIW